MAHEDGGDRIQAYRDAGLWDPGAEGPLGSTGRLELLDDLTARGATVERMVGTPDSDLISLGFDLVVEGGTMSALDLAERVGVGVEDLIELYQMLGVDVSDTAAVLFEEAEVSLVALLSAIVAAFQGQAATEVLRAIDDGLSMMANASISAFVGAVEEDLATAGDELEWARGVSAVGELGLDVAGSLRPLFRHHLRSAIANQRESMRRVETRQLSELSVGFVDLVGYTSMTAELDVEQLIDFTNGFRARAHDVVRAHGGRVVKHIGDEIMFSAVKAEAGCRIGLELVRSFGDEGPRPAAAWRSVHYWPGTAICTVRWSTWPVDWPMRPSRESYWLPRA